LTMAHLCVGEATSSWRRSTCRSERLRHLDDWPGITFALYLLSLSLNLIKEKKMARKYWKPGTMIYPLPAVMVSCGENPEEYNIITIAWTGTINSEPPMCYISVRPGRHSYEAHRRICD